MYTVEWATKAIRELKTLAEQERRRILESVDKLGNDPRPRGCKKLHDKGSVYRIRIGEHRVLYQIQDAQLLVLVVRVGNRRDIYR
ncbi:MAG: type II toxin-antitoxin system RelE/ParE family toxin [Myxococcota bacterium]